MHVLKPVLGLMLLTVVVACSNPKKKEVPPLAEQAPVETRADTLATQPFNEQSTQRSSLADDNLDVGLGDSIFFDLDRYEISEKYKPVVEKYSRFIQNNAQAKLFIQGHTDARGSREYNLSLGQKRANAVKQMMELLGAPGNRIEAVSFGKEKPACEEHTESCYAQNRRVVFSKVS